MNNDSNYAKKQKECSVNSFHLRRRLCVWGSGFLCVLYLFSREGQTARCSCLLKCCLCFGRRMTIILLCRVWLRARGGRKEGNVLFNDALNTFHLRLYGVRHMVNNHSDRERGDPLPPHRLLFPISWKGSFICIIL